MSSFQIWLPVKVGDLGPSMFSMKRSMSSVTITDPLVKYQSLVAAGLYCPDAAQHRLAIHLQKVYHRLKDYLPSVEYQTRLKAITSALDRRKKDESSNPLAVEGHPIRRNPIFARFFARTEGQDSLALTRILTSHDEAIKRDSPRGLFLSGEVGTGKSMLLDLLADGLPTSRKRRWHFNTFMLYTLSQLERHRTMHSQAAAGGGHEGYSLLWMAREMIDKSPILFLDEFQLPDRAASKILSNLFTVFFQLGGVLVASSNRMPEELEKATGYDYAPPATGGMIGQVLGLRRSRGKGELFGSSNDFASFLKVLKARCEFWQMEGGNDWRRREVGLLSTSELTQTRPTASLDLDLSGKVAVHVETNQATQEVLRDTKTTSVPRNYYIGPDSDGQKWFEALLRLGILPTTVEDSWQSSAITVYGRTIAIPRLRNGVVFWDFDDLVSSFGPADYISMASSFHSFVVDRVPVLTIMKKNEARRFITLLDALYEARCKLYIRAEVGPDDLFFPETKAAPSSPTRRQEESGKVIDADAIHSETFAEAYQDQLSPFRPNISSYTDSQNTDYDPDQDSDFGVEYQKPNVDFSNTGAFTGEDERFAYKRATSRLWELCGAQWHARTGDWWQPLPPEARHWEGDPEAPKPTPRGPLGSGEGDVKMGPSVDLEEPAGLQRLRVEHLRKAASQRETHA